MKRIFACDLDGTLVDEKNNIDQKDIKAIRNLRLNGNLFALATGRPLNGVKLLKDRYDIEIDYYILLNGALILNNKMEEIYHNTIDFYIVKELVDIYIEKDSLITLENGYSTYDLNGQDLMYENKIKISGLHEITDRKVSLISIRYENKLNEEIEAVAREINKYYGRKVTAFRNGVYLDIVPWRCSKGNALEKVIDLEGINRKKLFAIGDSWNDVSMFNITPHSFTLHYVEDELKEKANHVIGSVTECIEQYIL